MRSFAIAMLLGGIASLPSPGGVAPAAAQLIERSDGQVLAGVAARLAAARTTIDAASPGQLQQAVAAEVQNNPGDAPAIAAALTGIVTNQQLSGARRGALDGIGLAVRRGRISPAVGQRLSASIGDAGRIPPGGGGSFPPARAGRGGGYLN